MKICIITVVLNDAYNLKRTLESIRRNKQSYHRLFVVDGGSSDGTIDLINNNLDIIDDYISESDNGIYDAMNKALCFDFEENDFFIWLNAGDELLQWSNINIEEFVNYDCVFCSVLSKIDENDNARICIPEIKLPYNERNFYPVSNYMHQGFLIKSKIFKVLKYNTDIGLQAENLLMSQCIKNYHFQITFQPVSIFYLDGVSNVNFKEVHNSYIKVAKALSFNIIHLYYYQRTLMAKYFIKRFLPICFILFYRRVLRYKNCRFRSN